MRFAGINWDTVEVKGAQFGLISPNNSEDPKMGIKEAIKRPTRII